MQWQNLDLSSSNIQIIFLDFKWKFAMTLLLIKFEPNVYSWEKKKQTSLVENKSFFFFIHKILQIEICIRRL